jgi:TonB family protein
MRMRFAIAVSLALISTLPLSARQAAKPKPIGDGFGKGAYRVGDGVRPPMALGSPRLEGIPPTTVDRDIEIEAVVAEDGKVTDTRIVRPFRTPAGAIDNAAAAAIKEEPFSKGMLDGKPVPVIVTAIFRIRADAAGGGSKLYRVTQFAWNPRGTDLTSFEAAKIRQATEPKYTSGAMRAKTQGAVELDVIVQPDGSPGDIRVTQTLDGPQSLDGTAMDALKLWTFEPAKQNGRPVSSRVTIAMLFTLH